MTAAVRSRSHGRTQAGFTLLELIVALALLSLVLAALPGLVQMSRRAWFGAAAIEQATTEAVVERFVAERIASALPLLEKREDGVLRLAFNGSAEAVRFVAPVTDGPMGTGLFDLEIAAAATEAGRTALALHWQPFAPDRRTRSPAERILLPDVETFSLRYYGFVAASGKPEWSPAWAEAQQLPELIEVRLAIRGKPPRVRIIPILTRDVP